MERLKDRLDDEVVKRKLRKLYKLRKVRSETEKQRVINSGRY